MPAYNPGQEEDDILDQRLSTVHYGGVPVPPSLAEEDFAAIVSDALFGADQAPRFIILVATMHRAKGLEFRNVIVASPTTGKGDRGEVAPQLIYVALTRARQRAALLTTI